ncbi:MAG: hypothetical protein KatS3mg111_2241 [Pirellulaceae bacterium]|nr:MAG: hypothetical protein KatS3mg111_2241 [Pirellulaceae bacterium]
MIWPAIRWRVAWVSCLALVASSAGAQSDRTTSPQVGIRDRPPTAVALVHATVVIDPHQHMADAVVLIEDGIIRAVGQNVAVPSGFETIDCQGDWIYPAWIESLWEADLAEGSPASAHWNAAIHPEYSMHRLGRVDEGRCAQLREAGFGAALLVPNAGIIKGQSCLLTLDDAPLEEALILTDVAQHVRLYPPRGRRSEYPNSPMGAVALARQVLSDAQWYDEAQRMAAADPSLTRPAYDPALEALKKVMEGEQLTIFDGTNELYALRSNRLAREFGLRAVIRGSGREYRQLAAIQACGRAFLIPVSFPRAPKVDSINDAANATLQELMHWYLAPENPARLAGAGVPFALTADGLDSAKDFLSRVRIAVAHGLEREIALAAMTTVPAELLGCQSQLGTVRTGKLANLVRASGDIFEKDTTIKETWIRGARFIWQQQLEPDLRGTWTIEARGGRPAAERLVGLEMVLSGQPDKWEARLRVPQVADSPDEAVEENGSRDRGRARNGKRRPATETRPRAESRRGDDEGPPSAAGPDSRAARSEKRRRARKNVAPPRNNVARQDEVEKGKPTDADAPLAAAEASGQPSDQSTDGEPTDTSQGEAVSDGAALRSGPQKMVDESHNQEFREVELKDFQYNSVQMSGTFDVARLVDGEKGRALVHAVPVREGDGYRLDLQILWPDGQRILLTGHRTATSASEGNLSASTSKKEVAAEAAADQATGERAGGQQQEGTPEEQPTDRIEVAVTHPLGAYGRSSLPEQPEWVLVRGATIWTCGPQGTLDDADMLIHYGVVQEIGHGLPAPRGAVVVDGVGKHVSPGIIDCHSHMATDGGVNESGQAITAEVRIGDFIDPNDITIYRQLAGGVTTANILHGSANPIGGQNQVIKLRWGAGDEGLKMQEAPPGIKFALGENVKQSNWSQPTGRYPQSRMGVEQIIRDAFEAAREYRQHQRRWQQTHQGLPPRRDYELEAIAEILEGTRWIHCHSYRQDEILMFLRLLEEYGVTIGSLQHILEGYKVAEVMAAHGATGSTFSDWWAYKFEVYDAIPYNGALMHRAGVVVSFNSDDDELARHLNHEAAKAIKYGGLSAEEALQFVTLNPAKQLRIDRWVGSLEPGKHADFVLWSGSPLSVMSVCLQTWIDGRKYFDRRADAQQHAAEEELRQRLIQLVMKSGEKPRAKPADNDPSYWWARHDEFCYHHDHAGTHDHDQQ